MLSPEENELVTRTGAGTPMGEVMRRYWMPVALAWELPEPDCAPIRVKLLGEKLVAFRDTQGRVGLIDEFCAHRRASLFLPQRRGWTPLCLSWMEVRHERHLSGYAERTAGNEFQARGSAEGISNRGDGGTDLGLHGRSGKASAVA